ncbi:probable glutathione S-transferase [Manihot esculenta]|uniref:glutathione transferase n=1 Tax=Manihot esculenta TaxID=3983 RepID=A0A2C9U8H9_MANES|nr:probable glutathione S-transferase [Manihot esculenta]OAY26236.1 hypothetical protein MANES_16G031500v8 [Manihot esculenta]
MEQELILLDLWVSPYTARVKIALAEKGLEYESNEEDLSNKSSLLLEMNPVYKKVPVLIHKGKPISESLIIVQYIDEVWNHKSPLLPSDPYERAHARFWADFVDKKIQGASYRLFCAPSFSEEKEAAEQEFIECCKVMEGELGKKPYFGGETFGFVDIVLITSYSYHHAHETLGSFSLVEEFPKLTAWAKRCLERESVSKSLADPNKTYEFILQIRKEKGLE